MAREIPLTKGYVAVVDDDDYEELSKYKWCASITEGKPRAIRKTHGDRKEDRKTVHMSRQIVRAPPDVCVDHADGDTLNNRRFNLRKCTRAQNSANQQKRAGCTSRFKGVHWNKHAKKWQAQITVNYHAEHLGYFDDEVKAAIAYNNAATKYFGEFARLNEI
jgi:hypothetical protein